MRALAPVLACLLLLPPGPAPIPPPVKPPVPTETSQEAIPDALALDLVAEAVPDEMEPQSVPDGLLTEARGTLVWPARPAGRSLGAFRVTAFCLTGIMRNGERVHHGAVATDRRVIAEGTRMTIDGLPGIYTSKDTGSGVIGRHVDVWMASCRDALNWGVRYRDVAVVS